VKKGNKLMFPFLKPNIKKQSGEQTAPKEIVNDY